MRHLDKMIAVWGFRSCPAYIILFILLPLTFLEASAQTLPSRRYTTRDGLLADRVTVIAQDHEGYMWMGSLFGLSKYDGSRFTTIQLPALQQHKYVTSLLASDRKVYAGFLFGGGLIQYDKGNIQTFLIPPGERQLNNDVAGLFEDEKGILVTNTINQVYHFENGKFQYLFTLDTALHAGISSLVRDAQRRIWIGTSRGLVLFENGKVGSSFVTNGSVLFMRKTPRGIMVVRSDDSNTIFELFDEHLHSTLIARTTILRHVPFAGIEPNSFWGIDPYRGLFRMSPAGDLQFLSMPGAANAEIKYLFADRENNLWMADDPGVLKISNMPAFSYEFAELAPGGGDIAHGKEMTWCTNSKYLYAIKDGKLHKMPDFRDERNRGYLGSMITDDQDNLWINSWDHGMWKLTYKQGKLMHKELFTHYNNEYIDVNCLARDEHGNIWAGGSKGIYHIQRGRIVDHFPINENGEPVFVTAITVHPFKKEIWVGRNTGGLIKINFENQGNKYTYAIIDRLGTREGLTDLSIRSLLMDSKENLWIGTRLGGIFLMRANEKGAHVIKPFGSENGIGCARVTDISEEKGKAVWFATCDGISRFSLISQTWHRFTVSDGLLAAEIFAIGLDTSRQHVWGISAQGVTDIHYAQDSIKIPAPLINITQVSVLGKEDSTALALTQPKKLSYDENSIGFTFAGTSYIDEKKIRYRYMLEGFEKDWSLPVGNNNVNYASLPYGHYTFKVLASNGNKWSDQPATFSFQVVRPFYKSYWFMALVACLVAASFYFIRVYRLKQKLKLEKLRVNIARDLHDDIGSALGSINLLSENANRRLAANASVAEVAGVFQKIGFSAQNMLDSMDDIIWTINPEKDSLEDLLIRMREFAIPLLEAKNILFDINMHAAEGVKPSLEIRRNIYLVFKEAIFNIVRHSGSTQVGIKAAFHARTFDLVITDNGKGFDENSPSSRNGIRNMRKRADLSGAELKINTAPGAGTTIHFHGNIR
jgi:ligand-binding sensor domain-containing protein